MLIVRKDLPVSTLPEFVAYAKANHKKMQFGSAGVGSGSHFSCAKLNIALGIEPIHVPYRSSGLAAQDLMGGRLDYLCALGGTAMGPVESGQAKAIGLLTAERSPLFPTLRPRRSKGSSASNSYFWSGFFFPKSTPDAIVQRLHDGGRPDAGVAHHRRAAAQDRHRADRRRAPLARLSAGIHEGRDAELGGEGEGERHPAAVRRRPARELDNSRTKKGRREAGPKVETFLVRLSVRLFSSQ